MRGSLYDILNWAKTNGEVNALLRIRIMVLPLSVKEGIILDQVKPTSTCSEQYLHAVRKAAQEVVGKPCPM